MIYDKKTGFEVGDPNEKIFPHGVKFTREEKDNLLETSILSVSGWRRVFAADGDEESTNPNVSPIDKILVGGAARIYAEYLATLVPSGKKPLIAVGIDSRHTGPQIASVIIRGLMAYGCDVSYIFIAAAPEIMSYTKTSDEIDGFMYVSGSHNPIGHNGLKFGVSDGAVLGADAARPMIARFKEMLYNDAWVQELITAIESVPVSAIAAIYEKIEKRKQGALNCYTAFTDYVITGIPAGSEQKNFLQDLKDNIAQVGVGVLAEFNGSARTVSIDSDYLKKYGIETTVLNDTPRQIVHRIVPEGKSLDLARNELEKIARKDTRYRFSYVPDCDGDRGNIVTLDSKGNSSVLVAQEVFALSVVSELSYLVYSGKLTFDATGKPLQKTAVVVNCPTSNRIEEIARAFGAEVFRSEVGEANVVSLAQKKQKEGYLVRIVGEGSNGGNITLPSTVRDPINTIFAFIKMLVIRSGKNKPGLFEIWCKRSGQMNCYKEKAELHDVVATLPQYVTTSAYEDRALVKINHKDHAVLKQNYEAIFQEQWNQKKSFLKEKLGIVRYEVINYEGIETRIGLGSKFRTGLQQGGFKVAFLDENNIQQAFIWMRGSGTEPVFRVMADVKGNKPEMEEALLQWHRTLVNSADK
ncbi:MAG: phosphatidylglycerol lysyltransferase [bacterium]|nr:phosphatidylglycerol lysyltransferase [bacterium]